MPYLTIIVFNLHLLRSGVTLVQATRHRAFLHCLEKRFHPGGQTSKDPDAFSIINGTGTNPGRGVADRSSTSVIATFRRDIPTHSPFGDLAAMRMRHALVHEPGRRCWSLLCVVLVRIAISVPIGRNYREICYAGSPGALSAPTEGFPTPRLLFFTLVADLTAFRLEDRHPANAVLQIWSGSRNSCPSLHRLSDRQFGLRRVR